MSFSVSQIIRMFCQINDKSTIQKCVESVFIQSLLGWDVFAMNYGICVVWQGVAPCCTAEVLRQANQTQ